MSGGELVKAAADVIERVTEVGEALEPIGDALPWFGRLRKAFSGVQRLRLSLFLRSLGQAEDELDDATRQRFRRWIDSETGQEMLVDYANTVIRTSSKTAIAAFGLLFGEPGEDAFPADFRVAACQALDGIHDSTVDLFLTLAATASQMIREATPRRKGPNERGDEDPVTVAGGFVDFDGPYPAVIIDRDYLEREHKVAAHAVIAGVHQLIGRGLLIPDWGTARWGAGERVEFGVGGHVESFATLLETAKRSIAIGQSTKAT